MQDPIIIVPYDPQWPILFSDLGNSIRNALGDIAVRIDHIGSTSIPNLSAKPIIDVQISIRSFEENDKIEKALNKIGFYHKINDTDKSQLYYREMPGSRRTHIHIRRWGTWPEVFSLLFRDYMRCHPEDCKIYEDKKLELAEKYRNNRGLYVESKSLIIWNIMKRADMWSQEIGWYPKKSDK